jgi:hypothetical protein
MPLPFASAKSALMNFLGRQTNNNDAMAFLIESMFVPRFIRETGTAVTLTEDHRGAWVLLTNASAVTVTLPSGLGNGFLTSITPLGAGGATISGTHVGGSTIAQNALASASTLDDGSWFVTGAS